MTPSTPNTHTHTAHHQTSNFKKKGVVSCDGKVPDLGDGDVLEYRGGMEITRLDDVAAKSMLIRSRIKTGAEACWLFFLGGVCVGIG